MSKIDNFKKFVSNHPEFVDYVKKNNVSWQSFYELYDIYGEDESVWKKYMKGTDTLGSIKGLLSTIKNIDLDSLEENINSIGKAVGLVEELTKSEKTNAEKVKPKEEKITRIYDGDNE